MRVLKCGAGAGIKNVPAQISTRDLQSHLGLQSRPRCGTTLGRHDLMVARPRGRSQNLGGRSHGWDIARRQHLTIARLNHCEISRPRHRTIATSQDCDITRLLHHDCKITTAPSHDCDITTATSRLRHHDCYVARLPHSTAKTLQNCDIA